MKGDNVMKKKRTQKKLERKALVQPIEKANPKVDQKIVSDSLEIIDYLRKVGIKARGFNILRSSESRLKVKEPVVHHL
jgi:hypothetical protein